MAPLDDLAGEYARLRLQRRRPTSLVAFVQTATVSGTEDQPARRLGYQHGTAARRRACADTAAQEEVTAPTCSSAFGGRNWRRCCTTGSPRVWNVVDFIAHGIEKTTRGPVQVQRSGTSEPRRKGGDAKGSPLDQFTQNLNQLARDGKIDPLIGREHEVERVVQVLCRGARTTRCWSARPASARPPSPKAWRGASPRTTCPRCWPASTVYALDMGALLAGTKYRGDFDSAEGCSSS